MTTEIDLLLDLRRKIADSHGDALERSANDVLLPMVLQVAYVGNGDLTILVVDADESLWFSATGTDGPIKLVEAETTWDFHVRLGEPRLALTAIYHIFTQTLMNRGADDEL